MYIRDRQISRQTDSRFDFLGHSIMPILAAYRNFFFFFFFFFISSYVGFVPVSDVLAIFVSDWRCEFW